MQLRFLGGAGEVGRSAVLLDDSLTLHGHSPHCPFTENDVKRVTEVSETNGYRQTFEAAGEEVTFYGDQICFQPG